MSFVLCRITTATDPLKSSREKNMISLRLRDLDGGIAHPVTIFGRRRITSVENVLKNVLLAGKYIFFNLELWLCYYDKKQKKDRDLPQSKNTQKFFLPYQQHQKAGGNVCPVLSHIPRFSTPPLSSEKSHHVPWVKRHPTCLGLERSLDYS